jgi:hypothetical protein
MFQLRLVGHFAKDCEKAKLGPNLILLKFKVGINGVLCLLDLGATRPFVSPNVVTRLDYKGDQTHRGLVSTSSHNTNKRNGVGGRF